MKYLHLSGGAVAMLLQFFTPQAWAIPTAFNSKCGAIAIGNDTLSTLVRDTDDCKLIWVLPPGAGKSQFTGFTPSANLGMCQEVKSAQGASERIMARIEETSKDLDDLKPDYDKANADVVAAKQKVGEQLRNAQIKQISDMQMEVERIEARLDQLLTQLNDCSGNCDQLQAEYNDLSGQRNKLNADLRKLRSDNLQTVAAYDRAKAELTAAQSELDNVGAGISDIIDRQNKLHKDLLDLLVFYSRIEGGFAHVDYNTGWDESVAALTAKYGSQYQFRKVDTKDARIFANIIGASDQNSYLSSMPAILDYSIAGMKFLPFGEEHTGDLIALPSRFAGSVRLSLMGACPLYYKDFLTSTGLTPANGIAQKYDFAISATYKYPAAFKMKMTASYNLYKFYEKIVESSSSGGLFSSHTATSITENKLERDAFNIDWTVEDPDSHYDEITRENIAKEIKADLIGRVLGTMAQPVFENIPQLQTSTPASYEHGSMVLAQGLQSTCGYASIWCTAGAWVLRGLDSIFGSDSASSTYRATNDRTATETWSATTSKWSTGATAFSSIPKTNLQ